MNKEEFVENLRAEIEKQERKVALYRTMADPVSPDDAIGRVSRINNKGLLEAALREAEGRLKNLYQVLDRVNDS